jgi:hypothetical protein
MKLARSPAFMAALMAWFSWVHHSTARHGLSTIGRILAPAMSPFDHRFDNGRRLRVLPAVLQQPIAARAAAGLRPATPKVA